MRMFEVNLLQIADNQSYSQTLAYLQLADPVEIVLCNSQHDRLLFKKIQEHFASEAGGSNTQVSAIHRKFFDEVAGEQMMKALSAKPVGTLALGGDVGTAKYLALASLNALLKYVEHTQALSFAEKSVFFNLVEPAGRMAVDFETVKSLELLHNARTGTAKGSLFDIINKTKTTVGSKLLRSNLVAPLVDITTLDTRLDCVEEVLSKEQLYFGVIRALPKLLDLDRTLSAFVTAVRVATPKTCRSSIAGIIALKHTLSQLPDLANALNSAENPLLMAIRENLRHPKLAELAATINETLTEDMSWAKSLAASQNQEIWAVRPGVDGNLDALRKVYSDCIAEIHETVEQYRHEWQLPSLKLVFSATRGHHLSFNANMPPLIYSNPGAYLQQYQQFQAAQQQQEAAMGMGVAVDGSCFSGHNNSGAAGGAGGTAGGLNTSGRQSTGQGFGGIAPPTVLIQPVKNRNTVNCSTEELFSLNERANESLFNLYLMTNALTQQLVAEVRESINVLAKMTEAVALLDMLVGFASLVLTSTSNAAGIAAVNASTHSITNDSAAAAAFTRPVFTAYGATVISKGRHLLVERAAASASAGSDSSHGGSSSGGPAGGGGSSFVPNDLYLGPSANMQILNGVNCSGKTTYLKQAGIIVLLAHLGCFVPAQHAMIRITDRICTRIGTKDDLEANASTFLQEMKETAFIVDQTASQPCVVPPVSADTLALIRPGSAPSDVSFVASIVRHNTAAGMKTGTPRSPRSLVLVDELGRGTSNEDGVGIAWSVAEHLLTNPQTHCIFITHYHELAEIPSMYGNARVTCMDVAAPSLAQLGGISIGGVENTAAAAALISQDTAVSRPGTAVSAAGGGAGALVTLPALQVQAAMVVRQPLVLSFRYSLKEGSSPHTSDYGIKLAEICGLPWSLIVDAKLIKAKLVSRMRTRPLSLMGSVGGSNSSSSQAAASNPIQIAARVSTAMTAAGGLSRIGTAAGLSDTSRDTSFIVLSQEKEEKDRGRTALVLSNTSGKKEAGTSASASGSALNVLGPDGCLLIECSPDIVFPSGARRSDADGHDENGNDDNCSSGNGWGGSGGFRIRPNMRPATAAAITYGLGGGGVVTSKQQKRELDVTPAEALSLHAARTRLIASILGRLAPLADPRVPINEHNEALARQVLQAIVEDSKPQLAALGLTAESLASACPPERSPAAPVLIGEAPVPVPVPVPSGRTMTVAVTFSSSPPATSAGPVAPTALSAISPADFAAPAAGSGNHAAEAKNGKRKFSEMVISGTTDDSKSSDRGDDEAGEGDASNRHHQRRRQKKSHHHYHPEHHKGEEEGEGSMTQHGALSAVKAASHGEKEYEHQETQGSTREAAATAFNVAVVPSAEAAAVSAPFLSSSVEYLSSRGQASATDNKKKQKTKKEKTGGDASASASPSKAGASRSIDIGGGTKKASLGNSHRRQREPSPTFNLLLQHPYREDAPVEEICGDVGRAQMQARQAREARRRAAQQEEQRKAILLAQQFQQRQQHQFEEEWRELEAAARAKEQAEMDRLMQRELEKELAHTPSHAAPPLAVADNTKTNSGSNNTNADDETAGVAVTASAPLTAARSCMEVSAVGFAALTPAVQATTGTTFTGIKATSKAGGSDAPTSASGPATFTAAPTAIKKQDWEEKLDGLL